MCNCGSVIVPAKKTKVPLKKVKTTTTTTTTKTTSKVVSKPSLRRRGISK